MIEKMTQEQRKLVIRNFMLMQKFIDSRVDNGSIPEHLRDDFKSDMALYFCQSAIRFDINFGCKFSTYAYGGFDICCRNIINRKKIAYKKNNFLSRNEVETILEHTIVDKTKLVEEESLQNLIDKTDLTKKEIVILKSYYFDGEPMRVIGNKYNVTRARISQVINKVVKKLQRSVGVEHLIIDDFYGYQ